MSHELETLVRDLDRPRVLVVGDLMLDRYLWGSVERVSQEAPVPVLKVDRRDVRPGGAGSVATSLRALEAQVTVAGLIGKDPEGRVLRDLLKAAGIGVAGVISDGSRPTTVKTRMLARSQQMLRVDEECDAEVEAPVARRLIAACERAVPKCRAVVVQDHGKGAVTRALVAGLVRACRARRIPLIVDPAPDADYSRYRGATVLTPNRLETYHATGVRIHDEKSAAAAARRLLRDLGLAAVVITLDREGMAVTEKGRKTVLVPADAIEVYDVTGAGDAVAAAVAVCLACGHAVLDAARVANVAAGIEVGKIGVGTVSRREILERLRGGAESKVKSRSDLVTLCADLHSRGRTLVFTNGCFDLLHIGHIRLLTAAKRFGDVLVVAINSDASARRIKGPDRPIIPEDARAAMLAATECVDYVTVYDEDTPIPLLRQLRPDVLVKGAEYGREGVVGGDLVESWGGRVELVPMIEGFSTTQVAERAGKSKRKRQGDRGYVRKS